jgi:acetate kinase
MTPTLLVLNAGSSSVKFRLFAADDLACLARGQVAHLGDRPELSITGSEGERLITLPLDHATTHEEAITRLVDWVHGEERRWQIRAVAHRVVHGGTDYSSPVIVGDADRARLETLIPLAPLHQPHNLAALDICRQCLPELPQIACFDTAFHAGHSALFHEFALPRELLDQGVRRYGFHGLSYEWIAGVLEREHPALHAGRVVVAHLGGGASLCGMQGGRSIDTTMGMTALDGLPMGTRCGALDAGVILYLEQTLKLNADEVARLLYHQSGLLGLSGLSAEVETLLASSEPRAAFAIDYFALKVAQYTAQMMVSLGGLDALVFTGGIGEHAAPVRQAVLGHLEGLLSVPVLVIPTDEERMMAQHAQQLLQEAGA